MWNDLFFLKELADRGLRKKFGQYLPRLEMNRVQETNTRPARYDFTAFSTMNREKQCGWFIFCDNALHENPPSALRPYVPIQRMNTGRSLLPFPTLPFPAFHYATGNHTRQKMSIPLTVLGKSARYSEYPRENGCCFTSFECST